MTTIRGDYMLAQVYLNWTGTTDEFKKVKTIVKDVVSKTDGIELQGLYIPTNKWNYVCVYKIDTFENFTRYQKDVRTQLGNENLGKISARKLVLLMKPNELGQ